MKNVSYFYLKIEWTFWPTQYMIVILYHNKYQVHSLFNKIIGLYKIVTDTLVCYS